MKLNFLLFLLILPALCAFAQTENIGLPEIKNYKKIDYNGGTQNWGIDQDSKGNMFFANNAGLLQFDGVSWHKYILPNSIGVRCLKIDIANTIFVGGTNEFGFFKANSKGKLVYKSLSKLVQDGGSNIIDLIWKIHIFGDEVIFQSFSRAYIYKDNKIAILNPPKRFQFSFTVNNRMYFQDMSMGIMEYRKGKLFPLAGTKVLNNTEIWNINAMPNGKLLIATMDKGLFIYDNEKVSAWNTEANNFIKNNNSLGGAVINNSNIVLNSILNGIAISNKEGRIIKIINQDKGLQNNTVLCSFIDKEKNLWLGLDDGISFININSPFTYIGASSDLSTVYSSILYQGNLYVATNRGVFYHAWGNNIEEGAFKLVAGTTGQAWNLQVIDGQLFCAHNKGAFVIKANKSLRTIDSQGYSNFIQIKSKPNLIVGSNYGGFAVFEKRNNEWYFRNQIEGYNEAIHALFFQIDEPYLWFKKEKLLYQLTLSDDLRRFDKIKKHSKLTNKATDIGVLQQINNKIYFQCKDRFYRYSRDQELFFEDKDMSKLFGNISNINYVNQDSFGNIWYVFDESLGVFLRDKNGHYKNTVAPFSSLRGNLVSGYFSINNINAKHIFIGLTNGLAHYNPEMPNNFAFRPAAYIRSFSYPNDTIIIGNGQPENTEYTLPYSSNRVNFSFSSPSFEDIGNIEFSYMLVGFDKKWSSWSHRAVKEYTNLDNGDYIMKLKAKNGYRIESDITTLKFTISPPWYRHPLAYFVYLVMIVISIYLTRKRIEMKIRKNKYYEAIEQRKQYLERESKIKQEQYELEREIEKLQSEKLKTKILTRDKELVNNTLQVVNKNKTLKGILSKLKEINTQPLDEVTKEKLAKLNKSIVKEVNTDKCWQELEKHIKNVHFDFLKKLKDNYPTISARELDLCTYLLMNMSTKEIAEAMGISCGGVELARYRLRKKLGLYQKENLIGFLMNIYPA